jgi:radical SAM superfamily enzyme YgiQ (UPF0313 family)
MDLAAFAESHGCTVDVAYTDEVDLSQKYDMIGFSSLVTGVPKSLADLARDYPGSLFFGGKATSTLSDTQQSEIHRLGFATVKGTGEKLFADDWTYEDYPPWTAKHFQQLDRLGTMTEAMSSRGCPFRCHFCHNTETKVNYFSENRTIENARLILERFGRHRVFFVDDVFAINSGRMMRLLEESDRQGLDLRRRTSFFAHVACMGYSVLLAIKAYDPLEVQVGFESGDDGMLEAMGKTFDASRAEERLRAAHAMGIRIVGLFLLGFPGETRESLANTVAFVERNRKYMAGWWASHYQPVPNTRGWELVKERLGRIVDGAWNTEICYVDPNITRDDLVMAGKAIMQCKD